MSTISPRRRACPTALAAVLAAAFTAVLAFAPGPAASASRTPHTDLITEYRTEAVVHGDGTVDVVETITYDFGHRPSPGISRHFPLLADSNAFARRYVEVRDLEVSSPTGAETRLDFGGMRGDEYVVQIGLKREPDTHVTGRQTYVLSYTLLGAVTGKRGHDEFYWNFVGTEWDVSKENVSVEVTAPEIIDFSCYQGREGSDRDCDEFSDDGTTATAAAESLSPSGGLTAAVSMPEGTVDTSAAGFELREGWRPSLLALLTALVAAALAAAAVLHRSRAVSGARKRVPDLPEKLGPLAAYTLLSGRVSRPRLALITLVQLEERGKVVSEPHPSEPDNRVFRLTADVNSAELSAAERLLIQRIFAGGPTTDLERIIASLDRTLGEGLEADAARQRTALGLSRDPARWNRLHSFVPSFALLVGLYLLFTASRSTLDGAGLIGAALVAFVAALALSHWFSRLTAAGQRVRDLLRQARSDSLSAGPASVIGSPSWELALGLPGAAVERIIAGDDEGPAEHGADDHHSTGHRPGGYYRQRSFVHRWDDDLQARMAPPPGSGGSGGSGGGGGSGGFGGGSVGGGGGGGRR